MIAGHAHQTVHILGADQIQRDHIRRGGKHLQLVFKGQHSAAEAVEIHRLGIREQFKHRLAPGQIEIGGHAAILQVEIQQADARRGFAFGGDIGQFPRQVYRQRGGPGAACQPLNGQNHAIAAASGCRACAGCGLGFGGAGRCGRGGMKARQRGLQFAFGQGVWHEFARTGTQ